MTFRRPSFPLRALVLRLAACLALGALGCSGTSDADPEDEAEAGAGGAGGTGGTSSGGTGGVPPECVMPFGPTDPTALIDDIEDGNSLIATVAGRNGSWWVTTDDTAGSITPPGDQAPPPERILGGRCGESEFGMRITGQGFTNWGANLSIGFRYTTDQEPIDASAFSGVMFWARVGETHNSPIHVQSRIRTRTRTAASATILRAAPRSVTTAGAPRWFRSTRRGASTSSSFRA